MANCTMPKFISAMTSATVRDTGVLIIWETSGEADGQTFTVRVSMDGIIQSDGSISGVAEVSSELPGTHSEEWGDEGIVPFLMERSKVKL